MIQEMGYDTFSLTIFIGISVFCEAFLLFNLLCFFTISSCEMKLKLKVKLPRFVIRLVIAVTLGWSLYFFKSHFHFAQAIFCKSCTFFSVSIPKFLTVLTKYSLNIFAILISLSIVPSFSTNVIVVLALTLFEKRCLTFCQNFLLSKIELTSRFAKWSFLAFFKRLKQKFLYILYSFRDVSVLSRKNLFRSLERFIIVLCKPIVMNFPWFAIRYAIFIGACLFKIFIKMLKKCWYSILFMSCFNISLSSSALNSSFRKFLLSL